jgi:hypothetical protein
MLSTFDEIPQRIFLDLSVLQPASVQRQLECLELRQWLLFFFL